MGQSGRSVSGAPDAIRGSLDEKRRPEGRLFEVESERFGLGDESDQRPPAEPPVASLISGSNFASGWAPLRKVPLTKKPGVPETPIF